MEERKSELLLLACKKTTTSHLSWAESNGYFGWSLWYLSTHYDVQVPNHPGRAFILQGDSNYSPGVFPQLIVPLNQSDTELYIMNVGERNANLSDWKRVVNAVGVYPDRREGASLTLDVSGGVVYLVGGRTIEE